MVSMAFGIVGIIACLCCKDVDYKMTNKVCVPLPRRCLRYFDPRPANGYFLPSVQIEVYLENTSLAERNKFH